VSPSRLASAVWLAAFAGGCPSFSTLGSARVLDPGQVRLSPGVIVGGAETDQKSEVETVHPQLELGAAVGVVDDFELGARVWTLPARERFTVGARLEAKIQLLRPADRTRVVHLALAPRVGYNHAGGTDAAADTVALALPLLVGITFGDMNELVFGPQLGGHVVWAEGASDVFALTVGSSVGAVFWVSECFALVPEVSVHWSTLTAEGGDEIWFWQVAVGVLFEL
jgi:hypothetical protein